MTRKKHLYPFSTDTFFSLSIFYHIWSNPWMQSPWILKNNYSAVLHLLIMYRSTLPYPLPNIFLKQAFILSKGTFVMISSFLWLGSLCIFNNTDFIFLFSKALWLAHSLCGRTEWPGGKFVFHLMRTEANEIAQKYVFLLRSLPFHSLTITAPVFTRSWKAVGMPVPWWEAGLIYSGNSQ